MGFSPYIARGRSAYRNENTDALRRTASLPSATNFTACGWAVMRVDRNTFSGLFEIGNVGSVFYNYIETDVDGVSLKVYGSDGAPVESATIATLAVGLPFFWAIRCAGTGGTDLTGYYSALGQNTLSSQSTTGKSFTPAALRVGETQFTDEGWDGQLWNVRVWDRVLTPYELLLEKYSSVPVSGRALHAWWPLEGNLSQVIRDYSENGRHLTVINTPRVEPFFLPNSVLNPLPRRTSIKATAGGTAFNQAVSGTLSFVGDQIKRTSHGLSGVLSFAGNAAKRISRSVTGSVSFTGTVLRRTIRQLGGQLSISGAVTRSKLISFAAALSFVGNTVKRSTRSLPSSLTFTGTQAKQSVHSMAATLSSSAQLSRRITKAAFLATLDFVGSLLSGIAYTRALAGTLSFVGAVSAKSVITRLLTASLSFAGTVQKQAGKAVGGTLSLTGAVVKRLSKVTESTLSFVGQVAKAGIPARLASTLAFTGVLMRRIPIRLASALSFLGSLVGNLRVGIEVLLESTLSFSGSLLSKFQKLLGVGLFRVIGRGTLWRK